MLTITLTIAVLLRIVSNPLANVYQKQLTAGGLHPLIINLFTYTGLSVVCLFLAFGVNWTVLKADFWLYAIAGGIVGALGNGLLVKALQTGDLSVLGPVNAYKSVIGVIIGIFLLHEIPNLWGGLGVLLIIYGSYYVLDTTDDRFSFALFKRKEIQFRLWAMMLTAVEAVFTKRVIEASSPAISFVAWCFFGSFFSFFVLLAFKVNAPAEARKIRVQHLKKYLLLIICIGVMQFTTVYTFKKMPVGYALSLFQLSVIASVLLGYRIFNEQKVVQKLIGSAIMIAGAIIIILFKN